MAAQNEMQTIEVVMESMKNLATEQTGYDQLLLQLARLTETAERFDDMCVIMGELVKEKCGEDVEQEKYGLGVEERNMLSVAYKNVVGQRRASWRTLKTDEAEEGGELKTAYKTQVENELEAKCNEVLGLLEQNLLIDVPELKSTLNLPPAEQADDWEGSDDEKKKIETQVFYQKMCGDYYRYLAEFSDNADYQTKAITYYETALDIARYLAATHPTRLGLALNASVCYYEIAHESDKACQLAKSAFDEAIQKLDSLSDSTYKDSTLIMQLLRDNLTIWTSEKNNGDERED